MRVLPFILRRLGFGVFVLFGVLLITFILAHSIPGNPIQALLGRQASLHPDLVAQLSKKFHYSDPIYIQFYYYLIELSHGDLGYSTSRGFVPVVQVIAQTLPYTIQIAFFAFVISMALGLLLGVISSRYAHKPVDHSIRSVYLLGVSSPPFFIALIFLILFTFYFRILPAGGAVDPTLAPPAVITGLPILDALITGSWAYLSSALAHVLLPSMTLAVGAFGVIVRILRTSMLEVLQSNYIRTARAKGLGERDIFFKHAMRNALIPVVTLSSLIVYGLISGTLFVENIFAYPGLGQYVVAALTAQDYAGVLATTLVFAVIIVTANLVADLLYAVVDPQIRLG
jgi:peptide/nickel transport system permease protein